MAITKDMSIGQVVQQHPQTIPVFLKHGLMCIGWAASRYENIEQGARAHGINVEALIEALNKVVPQPAKKES